MCRYYTTRRAHQLYSSDIFSCDSVKSTVTAILPIEVHLFNAGQGDITCGAIDEPRKSSKAIDERVIIKFRNKNDVIARSRDKNGGFFLFICICIYYYILFCSIDSFSALSIAFLFF